MSKKQAILLGKTIKEKQIEKVYLKDYIAGKLLKVFWKMGKIKKERKLSEEWEIFKKVNCER
jgi:hypothetical protein